MCKTVRVHLAMHVKRANPVSTTARVCPKVSELTLVCVKETTGVCNHHPSIILYLISNFRFSGSISFKALVPILGVPRVLLLQGHFFRFIAKLRNIRTKNEPGIEKRSISAAPFSGKQNNLQLIFRPCSAIALLTTRNALHF